MRKMRLMSATLCAAMLLSQSAGVFADAATGKELAPSEAVVQPTVPEAKQTYETLRGKVKAVEKIDDYIRILVENQKNQGNPVVALNVFADTAVLDNETGLPVAPETLNVGDEIVAYHSLMMTRSIPPQTEAFAIVTGVKENQTYGSYIEVGKVLERTDKQVRVLTEDGSLVITFLKANPIQPYRTKNIVGLDDIKEGSKLIAWFDVVAESFPAQTTADRAVLIAPVQEVTVDGKTVDLNGKELLEEGGTMMVPLRDVAEALGYQVVWDKSTANQVKLVKDSLESTITIGSKACVLEEDMVVELPEAVKSIQGTVYVPTDFFGSLLGDSQVAFTDTGLELKSK